MTAMHAGDYFPWPANLVPEPKPSQEVEVLQLCELIAMQREQITGLCKRVAELELRVRVRNCGL